MVMFVGKVLQDQAIEKTVAGAYSKTKLLGSEWEAIVDVVPAGSLIYWCDNLITTKSLINSHHLTRIQNRYRSYGHG